MARKGIHNENEKIFVKLTYYVLEWFKCKSLTKHHNYYPHQFESQKGVNEADNPSTEDFVLVSPVRSLTW